MSESLEESSKAVIAVEDPPEETRERQRKRTPKLKPPARKKEPNYHVIIWNDEEHTYEYVIEMLIRVFRHGYEKAAQITTEVDLKGKGIAWTCHKELAELKCEMILAYGADPRMPAVSRGSIRATIEAAPD